MTAVYEGRLIGPSSRYTGNIMNVDAPIGAQEHVAKSCITEVSLSGKDQKIAAAAIKLVRERFNTAFAKEWKRVPAHVRQSKTMFVLDSDKELMIQNNFPTRDLARRYLTNGNDLEKAVNIYQNQIDGAARLLCALISSKKDVALLAEPQYGKTNILCLTIILYKLWQKAQGDTRLVTMITPNRISATAQTKDDLSTTSAVLGPMVHQGITLHEANAPQLMSPKEVVSKGNNAINNDMIVAILDMISNFDDETLNENGYDSVLFVIDEADEALGTKGFTDKMHAAARARGIDMRLVLCSATAWEYQNLESFKVIELEVGPTYSGLFKGIRTPMVSTETMAELTGVVGLEGFRLSRDRDNTDIIARMIFALQRGIDPNKMASVPTFNYYTGFSSEMRSGWDLGFNSKRWNGGRGAMLRYGNNSAHLANFFNEQKYEFAKRGITLLLFEGGKPTVFPVCVLGKIVRDECIHAKTVMDLIDQATAKGVGDYVIAVVDKARRADRFPTDCTVFIDLAENATTMTALVQGTSGRASGHNKINENQSTICIFSPKVHKVIVMARAEYDRTGEKVAVIKPSQYALSGWRRKKPGKAIMLHLHDGPMWDRFSQGLRDDLLWLERTALEHYSFDQRGSPQSRYKPQKGETWELTGNGWMRAYHGSTPWTYFLLNDILIRHRQEIERLYSIDVGMVVRLLMVDEVRTSDERCYISQPGGYVHMALRKYEPSSASRYSVQSQREDRDPTIKHNGDSLKTLNPTLLLTHVGGGRLMAITLALQTPDGTEDVSYLDEMEDVVYTLPKPNGPMFTHHASADEQSKAIAMQAAGRHKRAA